MKKFLFLLISFISFTYAVTFPIDVDNCIIKKGRIELTGWYGQIRCDENDGTTRKHKAIDIPCVLNTPVRSVKAGKVIEFGFDRPKYCSKTQRWKCGYGNYVKIKDNDGLLHIYAHLSKYEVHLGQQIDEGQIFSYVGSTGLVNANCKYIFANHLHYEVRNTNGRKIYYTKILGDAVKPFIPDQYSKYAFTLR